MAQIDFTNLDSVSKAASQRAAEQHRLSQRTAAKAAVLKHLASLFGPVDSFLRSWPTQVTVVQGDHGTTNLAHANGDTIQFSSAAISDLAALDGNNDDFVGMGIRLAAANYRACAAADLNRTQDVRPFKDIRKTLTSNQRGIPNGTPWTSEAINAFMAAETGRLETQYASLYPSLESIFQYDVSCILDSMLGSDKAQRRVSGNVLPAYTFVALRPYLDTKLFNQLYDIALDAGTDDDVLNEIAKIGEEFVTLSWPQDADTGRRLAERLAELCPMPEQTAPNPHMQGQSGKQGDDAAQQGSQAAKDKVQDQNTPKPEQEAGNGAQSGQDGQDDGEGGEGSGEGQGDSQDSQSGQGGNPLDDLRKDLQQQRQQATGSSAGQKLDDMIKEAAQAAGVGLDSASFTSERQDVTNEARALRAKLTSVFQDLIDQTAGGVSYGTKRGKLVPIDRKMGRRRFRSTVTPNRRNELSFDVAVLIDVSGSMGGHQVQLGEAVWAIKGGVDDVAVRAKGLAHCRTWAFNTNSSLFLYEGQRLHPDQMSVPLTGGGTSPAESLKEAQEWLTKSQASNKLLVILTDGAWEGSGDSERKIASINKIPGATSVLFGMGRAVGGYGDHGCEHSMDLDQLSSMAIETRKIIRKSLQDRVGHR